MSDNRSNETADKDGVVESINWNPWQPSGCVWIWTKQGSLMQLNYWGTAELRELAAWVKNQGASFVTKDDLRPEQLSIVPQKQGYKTRNSHQNQQRSNSKPPKPGDCPDCGYNRWMWDKGSRGWYCGQWLDDSNSYCGFKSWLD